ncbi:protein transport protein SEC20 [Geosmithia morbida]|uniref:Protein transport protein SEC20 n=1 Tax=Geosmithia morbida TaxID=1094350 RepID=A0A9P4YY87_9HYPO|nr:protein transport protein SEC20 [Geosmithia morbida]KAF4123997.1 protein transport protein SEC20 [Geosmithia morbida]
MTFEGLQERLTALQETTSQLRDLIDRLDHLDFQPGSVPLDASNEDGELSAEIGVLLRDGDEETELLGEEVEDLRHEDKARLKESVERQQQELERCRRQFRKARLEAKKRLVHAQRLERELVVQSYSLPASGVQTPTTGEDGGNHDVDDGTVNSDRQTQTQAQLRQRLFPNRKARYDQGQQQMSGLSEKDRQTVGASSRVTDSLRQMHASLQAELERSEYANRTMQESTAAFHQLHESYSSLETMLTSSRDLLGTLLRSQKSDTWYLTTALYMLVVVGAWLVFRRLLYGPLWWLVWLPLRVVFGVGVKTGSAVVGRSGSGSGAGSHSEQTMTGMAEVTYTDVDGLGLPELPTAKVGEQLEDDGDGLMEHVAEVVEEHMPSSPPPQQQQQEVDDDDIRQRDEL